LSFFLGGVLSNISTGKGLDGRNKYHAGHKEFVGAFWSKLVFYSVSSSVSFILLEILSSRAVSVI
jgi:hypothetical protein